MQVGDLVVEHIDDRIGTIIKIGFNRKKYRHLPTATVLLQDGSIEDFPVAYLGRYK